jgi:hypothetical protein
MMIMRHEFRAIMTGPAALHDHERALVEALILPARRFRWLALLPSPSGRHRLLTDAGADRLSFRDAGFPPGIKAALAPLIRDLLER